ncbi:response regulator transcription factor [Intestinimonas sp. MSJ-38]|uniref:response regulator transcription factor n=1 Tax=Intestinimonas sp. MSJ-38 TaxID=2841532 RepID=UPI001C101443|nr:response regulator transcription factor [Intestinimonas sp. MSJ-38]MBU5432221.1 response regulator transcription factor [Intestinimonas sp. MSJ-38]
MEHILLVEDDRAIVMGLTYSLEQEGYQVTVQEDRPSALKVLEEQTFDLCLLDLTLPGGSGYDVCRRVKELGDTPVIFLTAMDDEVNVVMGLDMGADDYITKPFRVRELLSRIRSVLRRARRGGENLHQLTIGSLTVNTQEARVWKRGEEVFLTALEYRLLLTFLNHPGQVLTRSQLLEGIWDVAGDFVNDNTLTVYIKRLREKLEDNPQAPQIIKTVRGVGYKLERGEKA